MSETLLYAPNVHFFAYHSQENALNVHREKIIEQLKNQTSNWKESKDYKTFEAETTDEKQPLKGYYSFQQKHDTHILDFNIRIPEKHKNQKTEEVSLKIFQQLNPESCLFFPAETENNSFFGQTFIITGTLQTLTHAAERTQEALKNIAEECVKNFTKNPPPLYQQSKLFGSPIFEFFDYKNPKTSLHIIVWLYTQDTTSFIFLEEGYNHLIDLFLYRHKNLYVYQQTRIVQTVSTAEFQKIVSHFNFDSSQITTAINTQENLDNYNTKLKEIYKIGKDYSELFTEIESRQNTININTGNYRELINNLKEKLPNQDLQFLENFLKKSQEYQAQITADIGYFSTNLRLIEQQTNTIRGLVEIQQAQIDRDLQNTLQALATGLATGGIIAANLPYLIKQEPEKYEIKPPFTTPTLHPFILSLLLSFGAGIGAWFIVSLRLKGKKFIQPFLPQTHLKKLSSYLQNLQQKNLPSSKNNSKP